MTEQDHIDLAKFLRELKGMVIISGYPSELYDDLYKGWQYGRQKRAFGRQCKNQNRVPMDELRKQ